MDLSILSPLERVVYPYVCRGFTNQEISQLTGNSLNTIKRSICRVRQKLGGLSRIGLILSYAHEHPTPDDEVLLAEFQHAAAFKQALTKLEHELLATFTAQWSHHLMQQLNGSHLPEPTETSVAGALNVPPKTVGGRVWMLTQMHHSGTNMPLFIRWFVMSQQYAQLKLEDQTLPQLPLSKIQADIAVLIAPGWTTTEIAQALKVTRDVITKHIPYLLRKLGKTRLELVLEFVDVNLGGDLLPPQECRGAVNLIKRLQPSQRRIIEAYLITWQRYLDTPPALREAEPTHHDVAAALEVADHYITATVSESCAIVGMEGWRQLLRMYYVASLWLFTAGDNA